MPRFALLILLPAVLLADTAVRDDGRRLDGELRLSKTGQLVFTPSQRDASLDGLTEYRFAASPPPFRLTPGMLLTLSGDQRLSGVLLGIEKDRIALRTAWADRLEVPRDVVLSLTHLPGWCPVFHDDLAGKLTAWTTKGEPKTESASVVLTRPGQSLTHTLASTIDEGRIGVNLREQDAPQGANWLVEAVFAHKDGDRVIRIALGEGNSLTVSTDRLKGASGEAARAKDIRRLLLDFSAGSLRITADDAVVWYTLDAGPGGPLKSVRLACVDLDQPKKATGSVAFSHFSIERAVSPDRHPAGDARQDELWLADGDQLFGHVVRADAREVEIKGRFGVKRYAWTDLRGWFPRRGDKPPVAKDPVVRLGIRGGLRAEHDELTGTLTALDAKSIAIRHPSLGELILPRDRVAWLRPSSAR